jgi:DNA-binding transcriptional ArsR family regulator
MVGDVDLAGVAALVADESRARMLDALLDGRALPATQLAAAARTSRPNASMHLTKLVAAGLLEVEQQGRHRYFRLASPRVATALEALAEIAPARPPRSLRDATIGERLSRARSCYDHLAGRLGVALTEALVAEGSLVNGDDGYAVTTDGARRFASFGISVDELRRKRRAFARRCLDWSERRQHVGGALGAALLDRLLELEWVERRAQTRALEVTPAGTAGLREEFGV